MQYNKFEMTGWLHKHTVKKTVTLVSNRQDSHIRTN